MTLLTLVSIFYLTSAIGYLLFLFIQKPMLHRLSFGILTAGFLLHTGLIATEFFQTGFFPVHTMHHTLSFTAWTLAGVYLLVRYRYHLNMLGAYAMPIAAALMIAAACIPAVPTDHGTQLRSFWLILHVGFVFIGQSCMALACGAGMFYLIQENAIKSKKNRFFLKRLPSLEFLDTTGYLFIITGFTMLTIGLITGFVYAHQVWGRLWSWDPKEIWSGVSWLVYAALLHGRLVAGWRGRRSAIMAIIGFAALLFTFLGVNIFLGGHHDTFTRW
jgi:cytochrome c-type biogenesis protein CcsB